MKDEVEAAVKFITKLIKQNSKITEEDLQKFQRCLKLFLIQKFINHWHPHKPWQGQGYRCLRLNGTNGKEPTIEKAASECGLDYADLKLPLELTVWVDPNEVCCRFGEHKGSYCTVASFEEGKKKTYIDDINLTNISNLNTSDDCGVLKSNEKKETLSTKENMFPNPHYSREHIGLATPTRALNIRLVDVTQADHHHHVKGVSHANFGSFPMFQRESSTPPVHYSKNSTSPAIGFASPGSPQQSYFSNLGSDYRHHFSSHENLNFSRLSPVNLNRSNWSGGIVQCNAFQRHQWYINRHMARV